MKRQPQKACKGGVRPAVESRSETRKCRTAQNKQKEGNGVEDKGNSKGKQMGAQTIQKNMHLARMARGLADGNKKCQRIVDVDSGSADLGPATSMGHTVKTGSVGEEVGRTPSAEGVERPRARGHTRTL